MSTTVDSPQKVILSRRTLRIAAMVFVSAALVAGYIWIMTAQTIAPPGLRILDFLWQIFTWFKA